MTDEKLIEQVATSLCQSALRSKKCPCLENGVFRCADEYPGTQARSILPIIKAERIRGGEMVKEAAIQKSYAWCPSHTGLNTVGDWLRKDLCALSVPAIVEAGDGDL